MSTIVKIKTPDKHTIYGTLTISKKRSSKLLVFVHGFGGFQNEHIFYNAAKFFPPKGFNVFRFDLYSGEKGGRTLSTTSIATHASDVNTVVNRFRKQYKNIFLIGHSLGGLSILTANHKHVKGLILWDSSRADTPLKNEFRYNASLKKYIVSWGFEVLAGKEMVKEWKNFPKPKELAQKVTVPLKVICAGKGVLVKAGKEYYEHAKVPKSFSLIKEAGHNFDEDSVEDRLFNETLGFVKKF